MTREQLQAARAAHGRQQQNPILTLEDAIEWFERHPLCLYLPRRAQLPAPSPSFVEATLGRAEATPAAAAIAEAQSLVTRLIESGRVVALNLFGTVGEQPDFLVSAQALPYVLCLRADADWKHAPEKSSGHKVSPLVLELWKALDQKGPLTASEARETLGRELTEAAVLRGLGELWQGLRISPVYGEAGQPARWELLRTRHREALATAGSTSQVTALSLLVSIYLQSVYAATAEEIEIFLSPLASRSRVREAVRGLSATRQIQSLSMDSETYYFLEGGLPEFAPVAEPAVAISEPERPAARVTAPRRPAAAAAPKAQWQARPDARDAKKPRWQEKSPGSFPPGRRAAPAPGPAAAGSRPDRAPRPAAGPARPSGRPSPGRDGKKPWAGKPAAGRPAYPPRPSSRPGSGRDGERTAAPARSGPQKPSQPWVRAGARPRPGPGAPPAFRSAGKPDRDRSRSFDRKPGGERRPERRPDRPARPGGSRTDRPRPSGMVPGGAPEAGAASGRGPGRPSAPFRSQPRRPDRAARPGAPPRPGRPDARPARSGPPRSGPPRPGPARTGDRPPARPPFRSSSRPAPSWPRTGPPAGGPGGRPSGKPAGKPGGRPGGRPGGKPGGRPGKGPPRFGGGKPRGKKPGA